jgi:hypothetical protein
MERMLLRALDPETIVARSLDLPMAKQRDLPIGRASSAASDRPLRPRASISRCESAKNSIHFTPSRAFSRYGSGLRTHAKIPLCLRRFRTLTRHHQELTRKTWWLRGKALASTCAAISGVACGAYDCNKWQSTDSARPNSGQRKPRMNDLGTWAEL